MQKATHEAKEHTSWSEKNEAYDAALRKFVIATLADAEFLGDLESFVSAAAQTRLHQFAGADFAQTDRAWRAGHLSRHRDLELKPGGPGQPAPGRILPCASDCWRKAVALSAEEAWREWDSGLPKLWLIRQVLNLRAKQPGLFATSRCLRSHGRAGTGQRACCGLSDAGRNLIALVPRLVIGLHENWGDYGGGNAVRPVAQRDSPANRWRAQGRVLPICWPNFPWPSSRGKKIYDANISRLGATAKKSRSPGRRAAPSDDAGSKWLVDGRSASAEAGSRLRIYT